MSLLKGGAIVEDPWAGRFVPYAERGPGAEAIVLGPTDDVRALAPFPPALRAVALTFPKAGDGRAFTQARILREELGFAGELRAVGAVYRDQIFYMARCGFDAFEMAEPDDLPGWVAALAKFSSVYQPAADGRVPAFRARARG